MRFDSSIRDVVGNLFLVCCDYYSDFCCRKGIFLVFSDKKQRIRQITLYTLVVHLPWWTQLPSWCLQIVYLSISVCLSMSLKPFSGCINFKWPSIHGIELKSLSTEPTRPAPGRHLSSLIGGRWC